MTLKEEFYEKFTHGKDEPFITPYYALNCEKLWAWVEDKITNSTINAVDKSYDKAIDDAIKVLSDAYAKTKSKLRIDNPEYLNDSFFDHFNGAKCVIESLLNDVQQLKEKK